MSYLLCMILVMTHTCYMCAYCTGKVSVLKYVFDEATFYSCSMLLRKADGKQSSLSVLYDALVMCDTSSGNTPLHLCSKVLAHCSQIRPSNKHLCCVNSLIDFIEGRQQRVEQCENVPIT